MLRTLYAALSVPVLSTLASPPTGGHSGHEGGWGQTHGNGAGSHGPSGNPHRPYSGSKSGPVCVVEPAANGSDSAPAVIDAFQRCGHNNASERGTVVFKNETYTIATVMNTTGLSNVDIDLRGTLSWDNSDIPYWLNHSLPVGYQNQSSAWLFGGDNLRWDGYGYGTLDGNGQV